MAEYEDPKMQEAPDDSEEFELGHTDKLVGVFASPSETFTKLSNFPPKVIDWFLPMFIVIIVGVFANFVKMSNPAINYEIKQKQMEAQQKALDEMVLSGKMTREQADQQIEATSKFMDSPFLKVIAVAGGLIVGFIVFFIMAGIYHLILKFGLRGDGTYSYTLAAYGLVSYILILQHILATILSLAAGKLYIDVSLASILGMSKGTALGFALSYLDPIAIWFYVVLGIAFSKVFKSDNSKKYIIAVIAIWVGISLVFFLLAKMIPFFGNFIGMQ